MRYGFRNAIGGISTKPEKVHQRKLSASFTINKQDTERAVITRIVDLEHYDIKLYKTGRTLPSILTVEQIDKSYVVGSEVLIGYNKGNRQQICIIGQYKNPYNGNVNTSQTFTSRSSKQPQETFAEFALARNKTVMYGDWDEALTGGIDYQTYSPQAKLHKDLTGTELHNPKSHASSHAQGEGDPITPEALIGTKFGVVTLTAGAKVVTTADVTDNSRIFLTGQDNAVVGTLYVSARTSGVSFKITSTNVLDNGNVAWLILEP